MKGYRKVTGEYIEVSDETPVSATLVQVALRPSRGHVFRTNWATDPLNIDACWRLKTAAEQTADQDAALQVFLDSTRGEIMKALVLALIAKGLITLADIRTEYRAL